MECQADWTRISVGKATKLKPGAIFTKREQDPGQEMGRFPLLYLTANLKMFNKEIEMNLCGIFLIKEYLRDNCDLRATLTA